MNNPPIRKSRPSKTLVAIRAAFISAAAAIAYIAGTLDAVGHIDDFFKAHVFRGPHVEVIDRNSKSVVEASDALVTVGSGTVYQYIKGRMPHQITPNTAIYPVDAGSELGVRLLAASDFSSNSPTGLLAMSSSRYDRSDFARLGAKAQDRIYEVMIGRYRPWVAIGGGSPATLDSVFGALIADAAHHGKADGIPTVSVRVTRSFLWPGDSAEASAVGYRPRWHVWTTSKGSGTIREFTKILGDPSGVGRWPAYADEYAMAGYERFKNDTIPWIAIGNEFLNTEFDDDVGQAEAKPRSLKDEEDVRVFYLTQAVVHGDVIEREMFLYGRVPQAVATREGTYTPPRATSDFLRELLTEGRNLPGLKESERRGQRAFLQLESHPSGPVTLKLGLPTVILQGWERHSR